MCGEKERLEESVVKALAAEVLQRLETRTLTLTNAVRE